MTKLTTEEIITKLKETQKALRQGVFCSCGKKVKIGMFQSAYCRKKLGCAEAPISLEHLFLYNFITNLLGE